MAKRVIQATPDAGHCFTLEQLSYLINHARRDGAPPSATVSIFYNASYIRDELRISWETTE